MVFIDVNSAVVDKLNQEKGYVLELVTAEKTEKTFISPVRAVNGLDQNAVACEIAQAEIMATAVGVNILPRIAENIAAGIRLRMEQGKGPLNIIICENLINADEYLKELIERYLSEPEQAYFHENIGLLEASVGRMVPLLSREQVEKDPTRVVAEPYDKLPVKSDFIKGELPKIEGVIPFSPFEFYIERKLFIHNMAHAVCAYMLSLIHILAPVPNMFDLRDDFKYLADVGTKGIYSEAVSYTHLDVYKRQGKGKRLWRY